MLRKTVFWIHLSCGVAAGLIVLMMSVTGVILTYERQMLAWHDRGAYAYEPEPGTRRLPLETLLQLGAGEDFNASGILLSSDPTAPVILSAGRSGRLHLNPYTGSIHPPASDRVSRFFSAVRGWHRWFNVSGEGRTTARAITGAANLMFLFLVLSGIYLWVPPLIRWAALRGRLWFHKNATSGQARDFNWHHVFGIWSAIPLAVIVATATVFNYSWANNLVYRLAGEQPPQRGTSTAAAEQLSIPIDPAALLSLEELFQITADSEEAGDWRTITLNVPDAGAATVNFAIDQGNGGQPQKRHSLTLDAQTGAIAVWAPFNSQTPGQQARRWVRFLHTGEALGIGGQTLAGLVSFFAIFMVWTGLALSLRRLLRFIRRRQKGRQQQEIYGTSDNHVGLSKSSQLG
jgi:uncharacterized iron-regulated membrane protein